MSTLPIALAVILLVLLLAWLWRRGRRAAAGKPGREADRIDTLTGWPPQATRVLSKNEMLTLGTLVRALPEYLVLAQVPLARFVHVPKRNSYSDWLRRVGYQCVDFLVCDMSAQVIAVIELQPLQLSERARKRRDRIERTLKAVGIPLHAWRDTAPPTPEAAREALLPRLSATAVAAAAASAAAAGEKSSAPSAVNPFDDTGRDSSHDETIEFLQPPPSTWFDDLDSDPVPLSKR